jgi:hypothetical protein
MSIAEARDLLKTSRWPNGGSRNGPRGELNNIAIFFLVQSSTLIDVAKINNSILIQSAQMQKIL